MNSNPDLEKQAAVDEEWLANRVLELQKQVVEQQREIKRLREDNLNLRAYLEGLAKP